MASSAVDIAETSYILKVIFEKLNTHTHIHKINIQDVYTLALPRAEWHDFVHTTTMCNKLYDYLKNQSFYLS
jgi:hypothetical protein